jgi:hypothetical protein
MMITGMAALDDVREYARFVVAGMKVGPPFINCQIGFQSGNPCFQSKVLSLRSPISYSCATAALVSGPLLLPLM